MKNLKKILFVLLAPLFLLSCEPEDIPKDLNNLNIVSDTGEQGDIPDKKDG